MNRIARFFVVSLGLCTVCIARVRLEECNLETDIDYVNTESGSIWAPPVIDIAVEERIAYKQDNSYSKNEYYKTGLLRLEKPMDISGFARPIHLPKTVYSQSRNYNGKKLTVARWGKITNRSESKLNDLIKLKLDLPVKSDTECTNTYRQAGVEINNGQLCAGGEKDKDTCRGDSGSPLMAYASDDKFQLNWYVIGIVSFGPNPCGIENWPGVYTKVAHYVPWIVSNLRP